MIIQKCQGSPEEFSSQRLAKYFSFSTTYKSASLDTSKVPLGKLSPVFKLLSRSVTWCLATQRSVPGATKNTQLVQRLAHNLSQFLVNRKLHADEHWAGRQCEKCGARRRRRGKQAYYESSRSWCLCNRPSEEMELLATQFLLCCKNSSPPQPHAPSRSSFRDLPTHFVPAAPSSWKLYPCPQWYRLHLREFATESRDMTLFGGGAKHNSRSSACYSLLTRESTCTVCQDVRQEQNPETKRDTNR